MREKLSIIFYNDVEPQKRKYIKEEDYGTKANHKPDCRMCNLGNGADAVLTSNHLNVSCESETAKSLCARENWYGLLHRGIGPEVSGWHDWISICRKPVADKSRGIPYTLRTQDWWISTIRCGVAKSRKECQNPWRIGTGWWKNHCGVCWISTDCGQQRCYKKASYPPHQAVLWVSGITESIWNPWHIRTNCFWLRRVTPRGIPRLYEAPISNSALLFSLSETKKYIGMRLVICCPESDCA